MEQFMCGLLRVESFGSRKNEIICIFNSSSSISLHLLVWRLCALSVELSGQNPAQNRTRVGCRTQKGWTGYYCFLKYHQDEGVWGVGWGGGGAGGGV